MSINNFRTAPEWIFTAPLIHNLLNRFIDKIGKQQSRLVIRVNRKNTPELYDYQNEDTGYLWSLITSLDNEYQLLTIQKQRLRQGQEIYDEALLKFNADKEALVRHWLNRPAIDPYSIIWLGTLDKLAHQFEDNGVLFRSQILRKEGKTAEDILQGFVHIQSELAQPISLRSLSARCFWGDSKFLENHEELVKNIYPLAAQNIKPRPILMMVFIPETFSRVLFVENQDSFMELADFAPNIPALENTAIVYSAGFHGSAARVRLAGSARFFCLNNVKASSKADFENWWLASASGMEAPQLPCYFWGDLDYSGMAILAALRNAFPIMQAWQPGYNAMLPFHARGIHHQLVDANKEKQKDPISTGCDFADQVLLPLMRQSERFVDQEVVLVQAGFNGAG